MSARDRNRRLQELLEGAEAAERKEPDFVREAREVHGAGAIEALDAEARKILKEAEYPSEDCLRPFEFEQIATGELPAARSAHLKTCEHCRVAVDAAKPRREGLDSLLKAVKTEAAKVPAKRKRGKAPERKGIELMPFFARCVQNDPSGILEDVSERYSKQWMRPAAAHNHAGMLLLGMQACDADLVNPVLNVANNMFHDPTLKAGPVEIVVEKLKEKGTIAPRRIKVLYEYFGGVGAIRASVGDLLLGATQAAPFMAEIRKELETKS